MPREEGGSSNDEVPGFGPLTKPFSKLPFSSSGSGVSTSCDNSSGGVGNSEDSTVSESEEYE